MNCTVIVPWMNCHELAPAFWQAVEAGFEHGDRLIIVDNGSVPPIHQEYVGRTGQGLPGFAHVLRSDVNMGFHKACNAALYRTGTEQALFLNNDVKLGSADWLRQFKAQCRPGRLVGAASRRTHIPVNGRHVTYLDGWCVGGMTGDLVALGGFDEEFAEPAYWGDVDLSMRAKNTGMRLVVAPIGLRHLGNYTTRKQDVSDVSTWNHGLLERKHQAVAA